MEQALLCQHPFDTVATLSPEVYKSVFDTLTLGPSEVKRQRINALGWLVDRARELEDAERRLHDSMAPEIANVLRGKKLLLLGEQLGRVGYKDASLVHRMATGFQLTGELDTTGEFACEWKPATLGVSDLLKTAKWARKAVAGSSAAANDPELDEEVRRLTAEEAAAGWALGPFSEAEM
jgi:hypothetical protein